MKHMNFFLHTTQGTTMICSSGKFYHAACSIRQMLQLLCISYGRHLEGSLKAFSEITHSHQKLAVLVHPEHKEIYFPTHSPKNIHCIWINYGLIYKVTSDENKAMIQFQDGTLLKTDVSVRCIRKQMERCRLMLNSVSNPYEQIGDLLKEIQGV